MMNPKKIIFGLLAGSLILVLGIAFLPAAAPVRAAVSGVITLSARITGVTAPTGSTDAATKGYVDAAAGASTPGSWTCTLRSASDNTGDAAEGATVTCVGSEKVITGGCSGGTNAAGNTVGKLSFPVSQGWQCGSFSNGTQPALNAWANCCQ
jgi:hypothetical protein